MDRYLTLKDAEDITDELGLISESIDDLIEIFYRALDADKTGEEVCFPHRHVFAWMSVCILLPLSVIFPCLQFMKLARHSNMKWNSSKQGFAV